MAYRTSFIEKDLSGFVQGKPGSTGAMVIRSAKGPSTPVYIQGEDDVINYFGLPSASYPDVFEAIAFSKEAPCWVVSAIGDEAVYGGLDVNQTSITAFGNGAGRVAPEMLNFASINTYGEITPTGDVNGINAQFTGTALNVPIDEASLVVEVNGEILVVDDESGSIIGTDVNSGGTNTIDYNTGAFDFTLEGTPGSVASVTSNVDLTSDVDMSTASTTGSQTISNTGSLGAFLGTGVPALASATYDLDVTIDGGSLNQLAVPLLSTDNWNQIASKIQTALRTATSDLETVAITEGQIKITSVLRGSSSSVLIEAGTAGSGGGDLITAISALGAEYNAVIDSAIAGTDISYYIKLTVDGTTYDNIDLGYNSATSRATIISTINSAVGSVVASINDTGGEFIDISGFIGDSINGEVSVDDPSTGSSALSVVFNSLDVALTDTATDPTGAIPKNGSIIKVGYVYNTDKSAVVSHSIMTASPHVDNLAGKVEYVTGKQFKLTLYEVVGNGNYIEMGVYHYSLIREKDNFGRSLYYEDIFEDDPYVQIKINDLYVGGAYNITPSIVEFSGGNRGEAPTTAQVQTAWAVFQGKTKYPAKIFMDVAGLAPIQVLNIVTTYQEFGQGITVIPMGDDANDAVTTRSSLGINSDKICAYTNWSKIVDPYNDSASWISHVGSVGKKYAMMSDIYNAGSPAGIDENNHGGLITDWQVIEMENHYTDADLQTLDEAQLNPIIFDDSYGLMIYGDKTMQVDLSDTSFVGARRLYDYIIEMITKQVLRKQEFRVNDQLHRLTAKMMTEDFIEPIYADGWIRDYYVQCDEKNNNDNVLNQRKFILDLFIKVQPNSQFVQLKLTRLSQTQSISQFIS